LDGCGFAAVEDEIMARWLKVAVDTPYKTAIRNAARDCGVSRGDAFLAFFELYSWLDEQTEDGRLATDPAELNRWAGIRGFAESLSRSGWLTFRGDICEISNWGEHNGQCAKRRALEAKRQNAIREERRKQGLPVRPMPKMPTRG
jgi:hypothetical protein